MTPSRHLYLRKIVSAICARLWLVTGCVLALAMSFVPSPLQAQTYTDLRDFVCATDGCGSNYAGIPAQGRDGNLYGTLASGGTNGGNGTVYKITPSGTFTTHYAFSGSDGSSPYSGLTLGTDGNLYGTTLNGGLNNFGTIFKITTTRTLTTLHNFTATEGGGAFAAPVEGKIPGTFYGVTSNSKAYSITSTGTFKLLLNPTPGDSRVPLILASDGNFYGTTAQGGSTSNGTVFRMSSAGAIKIIYNFDNIHGANPRGPVVQGSDGNLYGTTLVGGSNANTEGVVFKLSTGGAITVLHEFDMTSTTDGYAPYAGLVAGSDGNFYGATYTGASNGAARYGTLFKITKTGAYTLLYAFDQTHGATTLTTPMQHTNGIIYGETASGGTPGNGVFYSLNDGISLFVSLLGFPVATAGQTVEILGNGLTGTTKVQFGSGTATFTVVSDTYITAVVPSSGTTGSVVVTTPGGTLTSKQTFKVVPVITSFSPPSGPVGTPVTITGSGFTGATKVSFGGKNATVFTVNSGTQITATVPNGAVTGKIKVTTAGGIATSTGTFTVH